MIARVSKSEDFWLKELAVFASSQAPNSAAEGTVEDWVTESLLAAREAYQNPSTGERVEPGAKLAQECLDKNLPVARKPV